MHEMIYAPQFMNATFSCVAVLDFFNGEAAFIQVFGRVQKTRRDPEHLKP